MKKLLILILALYFLSSPSAFADDISDFQIEGISIGDSLLDYMTEDEILKEIEVNKGNYHFLNEPDKYIEVYKFDNLKIYKSGLSFFVKDNQQSKYIGNKNEKYTIKSIRGMVNFIEDFDGCIQKRDEIELELSSLFSFKEKNEYTKIHRGDPSGDSFIDAVYFDFNSGARVELQCTNWEETFRIKKNYREGLNVSIDSKEIIDWFLQS